MKKSEFIEKLKKYYGLNTQVKKMNKIKTKLNNELKEVMKHKNVFKYSTTDLRMALDEKTRTYPNNDKIKKFLLDNNQKLNDYYKDSKFYTLTVVKIETALKMVTIDD